MTFMNTSTSNQRHSFIVSLISGCAGLLLEIDQYFHMHSQAPRNARISKTQSTAHVFNLTSHRFCLLLAILKNRMLPRWGSPAIRPIASSKQPMLELAIDSWSLGAESNCFIMQIKHFIFFLLSLLSFSFYYSEQFFA